MQLITQIPNKMNEKRKCGFVINQSLVNTFKKLADHANFEYEIAKYGKDIFIATITTTNDRFSEINKIIKYLKS